MERIKVLGNNLAEAATLSGGSWFASLPLANAQTEDFSEVARSSDATVASTVIEVDLGYSQSVQAIALISTNLTTAYSYRIRYWNDSGFSDLDEDSGWTTPIGAAEMYTLEWDSPYFWNHILPWDDTERGPSLFHVRSALRIARWLTIELDDESNPDEYVDIGFQYIGPILHPAINYLPDENSLSFIDKSRRIESLSGAERVLRRTNNRVMRFAFAQQAFTEDTLFSDWFEIMRRTGYDKLVGVIPDSDDDERVLQRRAFFGRFQEMSGITQAVAGYGTTGFEIKEAIR